MTLRCDHELLPFLMRSSFYFLCVCVCVCVCVRVSRFERLKREGSADKDIAIKQLELKEALEQLEKVGNVVFGDGSIPSYLRPSA